MKLFAKECTWLPKHIGTYLFEALTRHRLVTYAKDQGTTDYLCRIFGSRPDQLQSPCSLEHPRSELRAPLEPTFTAQPFHLLRMQCFKATRAKDRHFTPQRAYKVWIM